MKKKKSPKNLFKKLAQKYPSPKSIQEFLRSFGYNKEIDGATARSAESAYQSKIAHCLEGTIIAAAIMEEHGFPPLILSMDSSDNINHAVFVFKTKSGWGAIGKSRCPGLHGRAPQFRSIRDLAWSYYDPFIDATGEMTGYILLNLNESGTDWKHSNKNLWKLDDFVVNVKYTKMKASRKRFKKHKKSFDLRGYIKKGKHWW
jgi:hypothetical protein